MPPTPEAEPLKGALFREHQRFLWGLSYRMTGSAADADDVVQETFTRALATPPARTNEPWRPWLTKVALNLSRDVLRRRTRDGYVGPWLPGPAPTSRFEAEDETPHARYDRLESVSFAFLLALEALRPRERAVLLLRDVFDYSVREAAELLDMSEANVKTTHHRARRALDGHDRARPAGRPAAGAAEALERFLVALGARDGAALEATLAEGARAIGDGGGEFSAQRRVVEGRDHVARLFLGLTRGSDVVSVKLVHVNGAVGLLIERAPVRPGVAPLVLLACDVDEAGAITTFYTVLTTRKLACLRAGGA
jgi:RNA polymerase sigma-70 factor, ECF subfamily